MTKQYRKTGIDRTDPKRYAREYYARFLKGKRVEDRGPDYVDGRTLYGKRRRDWICGAREQMIRRARLSRGGIPVSKDLTSAWLRTQFEHQRGRCFYTGIRFELGERFRGLRNPSIDRLDSSRGYEPGNVVWCLLAINYAKNEFPLDEFVALLRDIRSHHPST